MKGLCISHAEMATFLIVDLGEFSLIKVYSAIKTIFLLSDFGCQGGGYSVGLKKSLPFSECA